MGLFTYSCCISCTANTSIQSFSESSRTSSGEVHIAIRGMFQGYVGGGRESQEVERGCKPHFLGQALRTSPVVAAGCTVGPLEERRTLESRPEMLTSSGSQTSQLPLPQFLHPHPQGSRSCIIFRLSPSSKTSYINNIFSPKLIWNAKLHFNQLILNANLHFNQTSLQLEWFAFHLSFPTSKAWRGRVESRRERAVSGLGVAGCQLLISRRL